MTLSDDRDEPIKVNIVIVISLTRKKLKKFLERCDDKGFLPMMACIRGTDDLQCFEVSELKGSKNVNANLPKWQQASSKLTMQHIKYLLDCGFMVMVF
jgi:hypothetical protein